MQWQVSFRPSGSAPGTGLGLSIVKFLINRMGGAIGEPLTIMQP